MVPLLFEVLVALSNFHGFWLLEEAGDELVLEHVQLKENVVCDLIVFNLEIDEAESLHTLDNFAEY